jgi:hypothetical protein
VSRQWKAATAGELQKLVQRPVTADLVALLIDVILRVKTTHQVAGQNHPP